MSLAKDEKAAKRQNDCGKSERDAERRDAGLFNHRDDRENIWFHGDRLQTLSIYCCDASAGFSAATEGGIAIPSSEVDAA
jgi:hypothetical protein